MREKLIKTWQKMREEEMKSGLERVKHLREKIAGNAV